MKKLLIIGLIFLLGACGRDITGDPESEVVLDPEVVGEEVYREQTHKLTIKNCSGCHGANMEGKIGPPLEDIGSEMSREQIYDAIINGIGTMPKQNVTKEEAEAITDWLVNQKK